MEFHAILLTKEPENGELLVNNVENRIFEDKIDAIKAMKLWKQCNPRMKSFSSRAQALESATQLFIEESNKDNKNDAPSEGCPFKSLIPQELKRIKEAIIDDDEELIRQLVMTNPRYLMQPSDVPAIIHSGTRSNALHIAAQHGKRRMTEVILELVTGPSVVERMYPTDDLKMIKQRQAYLLDGYLNMPKKGDFDTPLHQASKWGQWEVIQVLVDYNTCDTQRKNKEDMTPAQVACSRMDPKDKMTGVVKKKILQLLENKVYIPVYRYEDNCKPAFIGEQISSLAANNSVDHGPSSPGQESMKHLSVPISGRSPWLSPVSPYQRKQYQGDSPLIVLRPNATSSPITSPVSLRAYLGPLSPQDADKAKSEWKKQSPATRLSDPDKGLEKQGRELAKSFNTSMIEFWPFMDMYCDITSDEGLQLLENHLQTQEQSRRSINVQDQSVFSLGDITDQFAAKLNMNDNVDINSPVKKVKDSNQNSLPGVLNDILENNFTPLPSVSKDDQQQQSLSNFVIWNQARGGPKTSDDSSLGETSFNNQLSPSSSQSSFASAFSSISEDFDSAEEGSWVYIEGEKPTKYDEQVYQAIKDIDVSAYPAIHTWKCLMESTTPAERSQWTKTNSGAKKPLFQTKLTFDD